MPNRLIHETSPYLRQHAQNPVDWYPWGEEALGRARAENKPIILSVGYSACHWCHVMEHECFENPAIAQQMNENFISIKVDREERPDLDQIYQNVAQLMTRSGGWPLTVFLTPDLRPFFGGTYFPPDDRYGRPGFPRVLKALSEAYRNDNASIVENANKLTDAIGKLESHEAPGGPLEHKRPDGASLRKIVDALVGPVDWRNGGFGGAPKFPNTMNLTFLWRYGVASGMGMAQEVTLLALTRMAKGGIYDQLGGGFHRYSVDETWSVPHFEKMLYDNGLLMKLYSEVLLSGQGAMISDEDRKLYVRVLAETTAYVLREMKAPEGGFYSTQDADSEGKEGKFFVWKPAELRELLDAREVEAIRLRYGVSDAGNFENSGATVLFESMAVAQVAERLGTTVEGAATLLETARAKLLAAREKRVHPGRDDKILASWNGLMISGLAWASRALREHDRGELAEQALESAIVAMDFVRTHMTHDNNRLWSVFKGGPRFNAYLDDYAFLSLGALDLARVLHDKTEVEALLAQTRAWVDVVLKHFKDPAGGFFFTSDDHEKLIQRPKTIFDQAIPSGNAVMIQCLLAFPDLPPYEAAADELLYKLYPRLGQQPLALGELANAALLALLGPVTVSGGGAELACTHPHVFHKVETGKTAQHELLVCHRKTCGLPLTDPESARKLALTKTRFNA